MNSPRRVSRVLSASALLLLLAFALVASGCGRGRAKAAQVQVEPVARRDIAVTIEATGTVEPVDLVEVKSKASGQIVRMPVQVGSNVARGALLAQVDPSDVNNQYAQASAALRAAQAKSEISRAQKNRADQLFKQGIIAAPEEETARLDYANAQAALVKARTDLDIARQRRAEATVRAPIGGTVLEQTVAEGQVIASATSSVSGGTTLLKMADLSRIRMRALVSETDIGSVQPGQTATVSVDAFPDRPFTGTVEKIEPQAVVQQSVTLFPVLISISNEQRLLLPGMNGEVSMLIAEHDQVPSVPMDAVRGVREIPAVALALGLNPDSVSAQVQRQIDARRRERAAEADKAAPAAFAPNAAGAPDSTRAGARRNRGGEAGFAGDGRGGLGGGGRRGAWSDSARARWRAQGGRDAARGPGGPDAGRGAGAGIAGGGSAPGARAGGVGGGGLAGTGGEAGFAGRGAGGGGGRRAQVVFVKTTRGLEPRVVRLGLANFDYAEVLGGVQEGEQVALLSVAELSSERQQSQNRMRERMGGGVPGAGGAGGAGGRGGGGGGSRGGGR